MREEMRERKSERGRVRDTEGPSGGRGGSCNLNNGFFGTVMRSSGAINNGEKGRFDGWGHLINSVEFEGG